jgi:hypothetical protein
MEPRFDFYVFSLGNVTGRFEGEARRHTPYKEDWPKDVAMM